MTLPASDPAASRKPVSSLRLGTGLALALALPGSRLGLLCRPPRTRLRLLLARGAAQAALQVVEDEPDRRLGARRRRDHPPLVADDEDAAFRRRRLELRERAPVVPAHLLRGGQQRTRPLGDA